jgi:hypothetical protein
MHRRALIAACILTILMVALPTPGTAADEADLTFFETRIRPVLAENCAKCHGAAKQKGMLRLDSRAGLLKGGDSGPALVPGNPDRSLLIKALSYRDPELQMPPRGKLPEQELANFRTWIEKGAPWPVERTSPKTATSPQFDLKERSKHWSLQPLCRVTVPPVKNRSWPQSPFDHFILARLEAAGLPPAPAADRRTLLRRVTFDLIGLPPSPAEIDDFLADRSPDALARVVDRLLASPHYGERWGRHWLDLVRYAETAGHEFDFELPDAYRYRDYVIRALNADLPYDQLVREHVAGDLLEKPRRHAEERFNESVLGTGFWHLHEARHSPVDVRFDQADRLDNQVDVFAKTFLGLTVACARCHDHKFDAISTRDYYALYGYLESSRYDRAFIDDPEPLRAKIRELKEIQQQILTLVPGAGGVSPLSAPALRGLTPPAPNTSLIADFGNGAFKNWFVSGEAFGDGPSKPGAVLLQADAHRPIKTVVPAGLAHSGLVSGRLQGVLRSPTFVLDRKHLHYRALGLGGRIRLVIDGYQLIREPIYGGLEVIVHSGDRLRWITQDVSMWQGHRAYIELVDNGAGYLGVEQIISNDDAPPALEEPPALPAPIVSEAALPQVKHLLEQYSHLEAELATPRRALALADGTPVDECVFLRGNPKLVGERVPRRFLEAFGGACETAPPQASGRRELAQRLVDPAATPIVPRVIVNRLWQHHFGRGIVASPDDFGVLGQAPTHPELLDYLATELVRQGWSLKKMHRLMFLSSTYQMASRAEPDAEARDPQNKLLHRMPLQRLEAEAIRDSLLATSGRLDRTMFGVSVPPHLTPFMVGRGRPAVSGPLDGAGRRSIYQNVRRNFLMPFFLAFDYPTPFSTRGRRDSSNVPAQALTLMNNPFVFQQAELWARNVLADKSLSTPERIERMYVRSLGRRPTEVELADIQAFLAGQGRAYGSIDGARAWRDLCHVMFNLKEFIYVN